MAKILADRFGAGKKRRNPAAAAEFGGETAGTGFFTIWPQYLRKRSKLPGMRFVLMTAAFLTVASVLFNGYANGRNQHPAHFAAADPFLPIETVSRVNLVVGDTAGVQRTELEKQSR